MPCDVLGNIVRRRLLGDFGKAAVQVSGTVKNEYASGTAKSTDLELYPAVER